jgi:hypothetical protein
LIGLPGCASGGLSMTLRTTMRLSLLALFFFAGLAHDKGVERAKIKLTNSAGHLTGRWIGKHEIALELTP